MLTPRRCAERGSIATVMGITLEKDRLYTTGPTEPKLTIEGGGGKPVEWPRPSARGRGGLKY